MNAVRRPTMHCGSRTVSLTAAARCAWVTLSEETQQLGVAGFKKWDQQVELTAVKHARTHATAPHPPPIGGVSVGLVSGTKYRRLVGDLLQQR